MTKSDIPENLYHRTNSIKDVESILKRGYIIPSKMLKRKETISGSLSYDFVSLTEAKCNETGGRIQFKLKTDKINHSKVFNIWHQIRDKCIDSIKKSENIPGWVPSGCIFLSEFEWRTHRNTPISANKDTIEEIVLYENYIKARHLLDDPKFTTNEKIKNTKYNNRLSEITKKYNIPFRHTNIECTNKERLEEFENLSGISRNYTIDSK
jgi:hypothetical protein